MVSKPGDAEPRAFGSYAVIRELGSGGMGRVYEGRHRELGRRVALKVMHPALAADERAATRFLREARAAAQIRHPHVVQVFDIGTAAGLPFIVMELVEGANLASLLAAHGPLGVEAALELLLPVISAVSAAHEAGIVHRDLKPANLMLTQRTPRGVHPIVLDFGISKSMVEDGEPAVTRSEALLGTVQYMAPELTRGGNQASPATDQYALGVMLYESVTGTRPFTGKSHYELMHAIVTAPLEPPSARREGLPPEFDAVVMRAMHRDPRTRYPSVQAFASALLSFADRTTRTAWTAEFLGPSRNVTDLWTIPGETLADVARPAPPSGATRRGRWVMGLLAAYALFSTALLLEPEKTPVSAPAHAATRPSLSPERLTTVASTHVAPPPPNAAPRAAQPARAAESARALETARRAAPRKAPRSAAAAPAASSAPVPLAAPVSSPAPVRGSNAAPILD